MKCKRKCMGKRVQCGSIGITLLLIFPYLFGGCGFSKQQESILISESTQTNVGLEQMQATTQGSDDVDVNASTQSLDSLATDVFGTENQEVCVYVCGAVKASGVYHLQQGARVVDAIDAAGGCTKKADQEALNQAEFVVDGQRLYIPKKGEATVDTKNAVDSSENAQNTIDDRSSLTLTESQSGCVNLNTATKEQLMTLPGVGESKALAIIEYRESHGGFQSVEEIKQIRGIKDGVYNKIKNSIVVG